MLFYNNGDVEKVKENLTTEDVSTLIESTMRDVLSDEELKAFLENKEECEAAIDDQVLLEKSIVRLDKNAKLSRATKQAVYQIAAEKNDPKFKKLLTVWRLERHLKKYLFEKYGAQATARAKKAMALARRSKSKTVQKAAERAEEKAKRADKKK